MTQRTINIILLSKGHHPYGNIDCREILTKYMSKVTKTCEHFYTYSSLMKVLMSVVLDYLRTAQNVSQLIYDYFDGTVNYGYSELEAWWTALSEIQVLEVLDNGTFKYINGFTEASLEYVRNESTGEKFYKNMEEA